MRQEKAGNDNDSCRIISLEAENVKRLRAIRMRPDKTLVRIEGRNAQGKSSVLDAIAAALGGGRYQPELPVRTGERKARVKLELGELIVERRWTATGGVVLEVTDKNGTVQRTPQAILDKLVGDLTFDPLAFVHMRPKDQADILRRLAGLDFTELDNERERCYAERTVANRNAKETTARVGSPLSKPSGKVIDIAALTKEHQVIQEHNQRLEALERKHAEYERGEQLRADAIVQIKERQKTEVEALQQRHERERAEAETALRGSRDILKAAAQAMIGLEHKDTGDLTQKIVDSQSHNKAIAAYEAYCERVDDARKAEKIANQLDDRIKELDAEKTRRLDQASFPLEGLSIDPSGPTLNGIPLSQASSAEQLRTAVAIGLSQKTPARIMLIHNGSLLDDENLKLLHGLAVEFDAQIFLERVADEAEPSAVYIEDGEIVQTKGTE